MFHPLDEHWSLYFRCAPRLFVKQTLAGNNENMQIIMQKFILLLNLVSDRSTFVLFHSKGVLDSIHIYMFGLRCSIVTI